jgi:hypothetical protein
MIRSLRLDDIAALLLFLGKSPGDEAMVRGRLNDRGWELALLFPLLKDCLVSGKIRRSFICIERGAIQGLACLRSCRGPTAWEIERLLLARGQEGCSLDLLEGLGSADNAVDASRLFLRLQSGSDVVDTAKQAGFSHYLTEFLYRLEGQKQAGPPDTLVALRPKSSADDFKLFRLYCAAAPLKVRNVEGMTFEEWCQGRDRGAVREMVFEDGGEVIAWLRIRTEGKARQFDMVTNQGSTDLGVLLDCCLAVLSGRGPVYCLVPEFQPQLRNVLEERGFNQVVEYFCLSKQLVERVREPQLVPLSA